MPWKPAALISSAAFVALLVGIVAYRPLREALHLGGTSSPTIVQEIKQLNQLVTVRYRIQRVVGLREAKQPFGEESILLMVEGEARAGVDLANLTRNDIRRLRDKSLVIILPRAKLFETYMDENHFKVWDRQITWWTPWVPYDPDLEHKARLQAISDVRNAALSMGILDDAQRNAEAAIRDLLSVLETKVTFRTPSV